MKKAGIITFHCADNFGAFWQVYALQSTIGNLGIDVEIIDFRPDELVLPFQDYIDIKKMVKERGVLRTIKAILYKIGRRRLVKKRTNSFSEMRKKYLILSKEKYKTSEELKNNPPIYDYYISGSDQVWNPYFKKQIGNSYFLDFANDKYKRISYAASIAEYIPNDLEEEYSNLINRFDHISVRESSAKAYLQTLTNQDIKVSLDPTFLLNTTQWEKFINNPSDIPDDYIFVYDIEENKELTLLANRISNQFGYGVISYSSSKNYISGMKSFKYESPETFLNYIKNSKLVLSTSFHGIAFAIIFNKPFYTIPHKTRGSRMVDLLTLLELNERIIYKNDELTNIKFELNYSRTNQILKKQREESLKYLKEALNAM